MELEEKIKQSGLKAYDIHKMLDKKISVGQASKWIKTVRTLAVKELLWRLCDEKMAQAPNPEKKAKPKEPTTSPTIEKTKKIVQYIRSKEWPKALLVFARGYGEGTIVEVGDFWYFEFDGSGWKLPKTEKAEQVWLGKHLVKWNDFKKI